MRIYWIENLPKGALGMMARPRGGDWLEDEIKQLNFQGIDMVLSLLENQESYDLDIQNEGKLCGENQIEFVNFPIEDRSVPDDERSFFELIENLENEVKDGKKIVVHCRMGIGRTSLVLSGLLIRLGFDPKNIFDFLSQTRTLEVPDTAEQINWILERISSLRPT